MTSSAPEPLLFLASAETSAVRLLPVAGGTAAAFTCPRPGREGPNEDAAVVLPMVAGRGVLAIADGAGGHAHGAAAATGALQALLDALTGVPEDVASLRPHVLDGIERANAVVTALGAGAATTLAVVEVEGSLIRTYHVGDSEILVVGQRGHVRYQVVPHSPTGYGIESGLLDAGEAMVHEDRHLVSNLVGDPSMRIEIGPPVQLRPRDTVLVASDGLLDNLLAEEIVEIIRKGDLERAANTLADRARARMAGPDESVPGKPDDLTFLLYRPVPPAMG